MKKLWFGLGFLLLLFPMCVSAYSSHGLYDEAWDFTTIITDADSVTYATMPNDIFNRSIGLFTWNSINNQTFDGLTDGFIEFTFTNIEVNRSLPDWISIWMNRPAGGLTKVATNFFTTTVDGTEIGWINEKVRFNVIAWIQHCMTNTTTIAANYTQPLTFELGIPMNNESISVISYGLSFNVTAPFVYGHSADNNWFASLSTAEKVGVVFGFTLAGSVVVILTYTALLYLKVIAVPSWIAAKGGLSGLWQLTEKELKETSTKAKDFVGRGLTSMGAEISAMGTKLGRKNKASPPVTQKVNCTLPKNKSLPECNKKKTK